MLAAFANPTTHSNYLHERHFFTALALAASAHLLVLLVWLFIPHETVMEIPVRTLNIKLGDADEVLDLDASIRPSPVQDNAQPVENALQKILQESPAAPSPSSEAVPDSFLGALNKAIKSTQEKSVAETEEIKPTPDTKPQAAEQKRSSSPKTAKKQELREQKAPQQYVRQQPYNYKPLGHLAPAAGQGTRLGNSTESQAEILKRYEQLISLWIEKFRQYPAEARTAGIEGLSVVRLRIDRRGNVRFVTIDRSSGHQVLDRAVLGMIENANPLPPVPEGYKTGELFEFKIPISFKL